MYVNRGVLIYQSRDMSYHGIHLKVTF